MLVSSLPMKSRTRLADAIFDTFVTRTLRPCFNGVTDADCWAQKWQHSLTATDEFYTQDCCMYFLIPFLLILTKWQHSLTATDEFYTQDCCMYFLIPFLLILIRPLMLLRFDSHFTFFWFILFTGTAAESHVTSFA